MATAIYVAGGNAIDYTPSADVAAGDVVVMNTLVGVAKSPIPANTKGALCIEGVFDFPKATGAGKAIDIGKVYWDATNKVMTETTTSNTLAGKTVRASLDADTTVRVLLHAY